MSGLSAPGRCGKCGADLTAFAPEGLCPACMLEGGLEPEAGTVKASPGSPPANTPASPASGDKIGRYKILEQIGEGGCGVVYMAEQAEPVRRRVALKVIKLGMDTKQVIARFEAERQALALMDHPNIAKVHDAGATQDGRPYFVMELVRGVRITDYCDQNNLPTAKRLGLFVQVCRAIQHAHQKGVIHRDIKPSNILVTLQDGAPTPKVIDFGIAKATTDQPLTDKTLFTAFQQFIGTPAYMSPEQADLTTLDIDTRSDIYSLGVLLYELLTGKTPFDAKELIGAGLEAMRRTIREQEPPRPSTRLSSLTAAEQTTVARCRQIQTLKLIHLVRGDLDWIVMKCLEKDRTRRYETANGLGREIERFLNDEPVTARPPTRAYQLQKLVRRNKLAFLAASAVVAALLVGIGFSMWMFLRERQARARAVASNAEAEAVMNFLENKVIVATRPQGEEGGLGYDVTVRRAIATAEPEIAQLFRNQPLAEARIRRTIGQTFYNLSEYSNAVPQFERALELRKRNLGADNRLTLTATVSLADALERSGHPQEALPLLQRTVERMKLVLGPNDDETLNAINNLASDLQASDLQHALLLHREVLHQNEAKCGPLDERTMIALANLGEALLAAGQYQEGVATLERSLSNNLAVIGPNKRRTIIAMENLGCAYDKAGRVAEAIPLETNALRLATLCLGSNHQTTLTILENVGNVYLDAGRFTDALPLLEQAVARHTALFGESHPATLEFMNNLAAALMYSHRLEEAAKTLEAIARISRANQYPLKPRLINNLAVVYGELGRVRESLEAYDELDKVVREQLGPDHPSTLLTMVNHAAALAEVGLLTNAITLYTNALELQKIKLRPGHPDTLLTEVRLASAYLRTDRAADARPLLDQALLALRNQPDLPRGQLALTLSCSAHCSLLQGLYPEADRFAQEGLDLLARAQAYDWHVFELQSLRGAALSAQGNPAQAEPLLSAACRGFLEQSNKVPFFQRHVVPESFERLIQFYASHAQPEAAAEWKQKLALLQNVK